MNEMIPSFLRNAIWTDRQISSNKVTEWVWLELQNLDEVNLIDVIKTLKDWESFSSSRLSYKSYSWDVSSKSNIILIWNDISSHDFKVIRRWNYIIVENYKWYSAKEWNFILSPVYEIYRLDWKLINSISTLDAYQDFLSSFNFDWDNILSIIEREYRIVSEKYLSKKGNMTRISDRMSTNPNWVTTYEIFSSDGVLLFTSTDFKDYLSALKKYNVEYIKEVSVIDVISHLRDWETFSEKWKAWDNLEEIDLFTDSIEESADFIWFSITVGGKKYDKFFAQRIGNIIIIKMDRISYLFDLNWKLIKQIWFKDIWQDYVIVGEIANYSWFLVFPIYFKDKDDDSDNLWQVHDVIMISKNWEIYDFTDSIKILEPKSFDYWHDFYSLSINDIFSKWNIVNIYQRDKNIIFEFKSWKYLCYYWGIWFIYSRKGIENKFGQLEITNLFEVWWYNLWKFVWSLPKLIDSLSDRLDKALSVF